jgi:pyruvate dehydrogenase E2 component (dihydrolipoamide acetyltransferase)
MPIDVIMPKVDMVMDEGTVANWYKSEGDEVRAGEPLFDIETDKATMEVEAPASGTLVRITAPNGTTVPVASVIALILEKGETLDQSSASSTQPSLAQLSPLAAQAQSSTPAATMAATGAGPRPRSTPVARKLAREHGLNLATLAGGGPQGRIRKDDVLQAVQTLRAGGGAVGDGKPQPVAPASAGQAQVKILSGTQSLTGAQPAELPAAAAAPIGQPQPGALAAAGAPEAGTLVPLVGVRKIIAQRLTVSASIPQFVLSMDVEVRAAMQLRERLPYRPSITAILARVVASVLPRHATLNASFREDGIWLHTPVHLGIALDSGGNLLVPVIRNAHQCSLSTIASALTDIRKRAEAKKLTPSELQGSTFSISNLGMLGVDQFTALVNPPEAAILAVGRSTQRPFEVNGTIVFKPMMTLTLSADHRVTDGATAARFLQDVRAALEEPLLLL